MNIIIFGTLGDLWGTFEGHLRHLGDLRGTLGDIWDGAPLRDIGGTLGDLWGTFEGHLRHFGRPLCNIRGILSDL